jgi:hypothetical protein
VGGSAWIGGVGGGTISAAGVSDLLRLLRDDAELGREEMGRPERVRPGVVEISERDWSAKANSRFMARGGGGDEAQALLPPRGEDDEAGMMRSRIAARIAWWD